MLVFILFYFYFGKKEMNLGNNQDMSYDNIAGGGEKIAVRNAACWQWEM
jgi:hypothetical protein